MKNIRSTYPMYCGTNKDTVDITDYLKINGMFNKFLMGKVLDGNEIVFPSNLGTLSIVGEKQKIRYDEDGNITGLPVDWKSTREMWEESPETKNKKYVYFLNSHTDGYRYKYVWNRNTAIVKYKNLYTLKLTRSNKRAVAKKIKKGFPYKTV